jgi:glycosyltransferase involved in cell wall biosynthesis
VLSSIRIYFFVFKNSFGIIHFQILELPVIDFINFLIFKLSGIKIVYTPHDIYSFKTNKNKRLATLMYKLCNRIIVHNQPNKDLLISECNIADYKIKVVPHGNYNLYLDPTLMKNEAREKIGLPKEERIVLFFGNIRPGKGIETLISAFKLLRAQKNAALLIAGKVSSDYDFDIIKSKISDESLKDRVILRNYFIADDLIENYYKSSDVVVVPYEHVYESGVLKYAFSCGVPTIISDLKEFSDFTKDGENCLLFKAGDPKNLAEKLRAVLENENLAKKIAANAKELSDVKWDWHKIALSTREIYGQVW